jgi:hypothetical protein
MKLVHVGHHEAKIRKCYLLIDIHICQNFNLPLCALVHGCSIHQPV